MSIVANNCPVNKYTCCCDTEIGDKKQKSSGLVPLSSMGLLFSTCSAVSERKLDDGEGLEYG